ncbi:hypothetical protein K435DRAFT_799562 [Dendrothele bispora CBS 962.96]|uniref:Glycoside hydrolase family 16 protein n=1 Tax=Dendrothele bispora (strain CBS 962.96) TaxID=1314807 RepID=A0A4S8LVF7_DENBC|nr:hypothetical protein K435DRAFT_799562 [Dendrothele bispora CBS 962.96]
MSNSSSINISDLGTPIANWPNGGCEIDNFFKAQNLIFDIMLCGDFAGAASVFAETCSGTCYTDYVVGDGSNYANAYFDVASVRVFSYFTGSDENAALPLSRGVSWTFAAVTVVAGLLIGIVV